MSDAEFSGYQAQNARAVDAWVEEGWVWGVPVSPETFARAKAGEWDVVLTPNIPVPHAWFGDLKGKKVLGLASGGGQQMPVFAALGAECTVLDISLKQLESERMVAAREGYDIRIVRADMTRPLPFSDGEFDLVFHPVSNCYIRDVLHVWRECHRVLKPGGVLLAGLDSGVNYAFDDNEEKLAHRLPVDQLRDAAEAGVTLDPNESVQFSHAIQEQIGGQLAAGFILTHVFEDTNDEGNISKYNLPCFYATRAVKPEGACAAYFARVREDGNG